MGIRNLPEDMTESVIRAAEINLKKNADKFRKINNMEDLYKLAFLQGFQTAWSIYTEDLEGEDF